MITRLLPLLILACGLSSTPLFSLEQSPDATITASSVPQLSGRGEFQLRRTAASPSGPDHAPGAPVAVGCMAPVRPDVGRPPLHSADDPDVGHRGPTARTRVTYRATAPPRARSSTI